MTIAPLNSPAAEQTIVLRDYIKQAWSNELLTYPFSAPKGACLPESVTLTGPQGPLPAQLSEIEFWPDAKTVKSARLSFIANLSPLATNTYTVHFDDKPAAAAVAATDLAFAPGEGQLEIVTRNFGVRLLQGERTYSPPATAEEVPGPVIAMRTAAGKWFGGSRMFGAAKIAGYSAKLVDRGPVFAQANVHYTYADGNTLDLSVRVAAGDNTMRMETKVAKHQPKDGFHLVLSKGLPPLVLQQPKTCDPNHDDDWVEIPLKDPVAPPTQQPEGVVEVLYPWEFYVRSRTRLKLENTTREIQIRCLDAAAWVEPRSDEAILDPNWDADPAKGVWQGKGSWVGWHQKCIQLMRDPSAEVFLRVDAAQGARKWTISECLSMRGVAAPYRNKPSFKPESEFPPETRPLVGARLNDVKDYVLEWKGDEGKHPRLFINRSELDAVWKSMEVDRDLLEDLTKKGSVKSAKQVRYHPDYSYDYALGAYLLSGGSPEVAAKTQLTARLRQALQYEVWASAFGGAPAPSIFYDTLIDSPLIAAEERPVLRARMAYFGYRLTDPALWSVARGCTATQNMDICQEMSRGIMACAIPEHPMAKTWYHNAEILMEYYLRWWIGPSGEFAESLGAHGRPSVHMMLVFALASRNAGFHDYVSDPRFKAAMLHFAKMLMPRDPRLRGRVGTRDNKANRRAFPAYDRDCPSLGDSGSCGVWARITQKSDPEFAAIMQWAWLEEGASHYLDKLGGFEKVFFDKRLPSKTPNWISEMFPWVGVVLRHGLATADEHQVILYSRNGMPAQTGCFPSIFAFGKPVAGGFFDSYTGQEGLLQSHVDLARESSSKNFGFGYEGNRKHAWFRPQEPAVARFGEHEGNSNVSAFAALPRQDYTAVDVALHYAHPPETEWYTFVPGWPPAPIKGTPPVDWRRQVLYLKDDDPAKTTYLLIRDSIKGVQGGRPTMWQMWNVSEKIGTPEEARDVAKFLADKPGNKCLPARELKGDRFTAVGQLGVDVEYYIASPANTPRYTLRWGAETCYMGSKLIPEYQDLLHLQLPGDGVYYVAFFPRKRDMAVPAFKSLGDGTIIQVSGDFGTDYGFLSAAPVSSTGESVRFQGTAGSVQDRKTGRVLALGAKGEVRYQAYALAADFAASLRVGEKELTVELPEKVIDGDKTLSPMVPFPGGLLMVTAPGSWMLANPLPGAKLTKSAAGFTLAVPAGIKTVAIQAERP
jgi:hypothetical protein